MPPATPSHALPGLISFRFSLGQHRTIVSASLSRLFAPLLQFEKREIHTVFLRFPNFELGQKSWLSLLVKLCGIALDFPAVFFYNTFAAFRFSPYRKRKDYPRRKSAVFPPETIRRLPVPRHPPLSRQFPVLVG